MRIPNPYFKNIPQIGNLIMDYIIFEDSYPVLFVCKSDNNQLYLCDCCDTYYEQRWLIAPVTVQVLQNMLQDKITIREVFEKADGVCCVATWSKGDINEKYELLESKDFLEEDLPEEGAYIESEEDEYEDYIYLLKYYEPFQSKTSKIMIKSQEEDRVIINKQGNGKSVYLNLMLWNSQNCNTTLESDIDSIIDDKRLLKAMVYNCSMENSQISTIAA